MSWYNSDPTELNYNEPIMAQDNTTGTKFILMPHIDPGKGTYEIVGYDWFNIDTGKYNSCRGFESVKEALAMYSHHEIMNVTIEVTV